MQFSKPRKKWANGELPTAETVQQSSASADESKRPEWPMSISINYKKVNITGERHDYSLIVSVTNDALDKISSYHIDLQFPTRLLSHDADFSNRVQERSDDTETLFRFESQNGKGIFPGDKINLMPVLYYMDHDIFYHHSLELFQKTVKVTVYIAGYSPKIAEKRVDDLQVF